MGLDDRAADRQPQADAGLGRFAFAAREFFEYRFFPAGWQAGTVVADGDVHPHSVQLGADCNRASRRRVFSRVFQQVGKYAFDQDGVELDQRQMRRYPGQHDVIGDRRAAGPQGAADDFLDRLPLAIELHGAALDARHVEQVRHQHAQAHRFLAQRIGHGALCGRERRRRMRQPFGLCHQRGEGGAQVMRERRQQGIAQTLGLHLDQGFLRNLDVVHPFERDRCQRREGVEQLPLFRHQQEARILGLHRQHTPGSHRCDQRHVEDRTARQGIASPAGTGAVIESPLGNAGIQGWKARAIVVHRAQAALAVGNQQRSARAEGLPDGVAGGLADLPGLQYARQGARELVERAGPVLAPRRDLGLKAQTGRQVPGDQADREHHAEGHHILEIRHRKGEARRYEEEIETGDADAGGGHRGAASEPHRHQQHDQQEQHRDVGQVQVGDGRRGRQCHADTGQRRGAMRNGGAPAGHAGGAGFGKGKGKPRCRRRRRAVRRGDLDEVDVGSQPCDPAAARHAPRRARRGAAQRDPGQVVAARVVDNRAFHRVAGQDSSRCAKVARQLEDPQDALAPLDGQPLQRRSFDVDRMPVGAQLSCQPGCAAHCGLGPGARPDAGKQRGTAAPDRGDRLFHAIGAHVVPDALGRAPQGQFAQGDQVAFSEKIPAGPLGLRRLVHLALPEPGQQLVRRKIHQHHFVGIVEHGVGDRLADTDARDAADHVVQAFQVLHVHRGEDVDARGQQFLDVLPALRVARAGHVRVRQFVDQHQPRPPLERRIDIEFRQCLATVVDAPARQDVETVQQGLGLGPAVGLDEADQRPVAGVELARGRQHGVGLAHAGRRTEINAQLAARGAPLLLLYLGKQGVRVAPRFVAGDVHALPFIGPAATWCPARGSAPVR